MLATLRSRFRASAAGAGAPAAPATPPVSPFAHLAAARPPAPAARAQDDDKKDDKDKTTKKGQNDDDDACNDRKRGSADDEGDEDDKKKTKKKAQDDDDKKKDDDEKKSKRAQDDDEKKKDAAAVGNNNAGDVRDEGEFIAKVARARERGRIFAIMCSDQGKANPVAAAHLAMQTSMPRDEAIAMLSAIGTNAAPPRADAPPSLRDRMATVADPKLGAGDAGGEPTLAQQIIAAAKKARGEA
jgi:hypothetical protein